MISRIINKIRYYNFKKLFKEFGKGSFVDRPLKIQRPHNISIGDKTFIAYNSWLAAQEIVEGTKATLVIGNNCQIGNFNHIYATKEIIIEDYVLTADKVYISDNIHGYDDINTPILLQPVVQKKATRIGTGSWLGENVCIIGCIIGKQCVVGANSVVTKDIPDYCVAVGAPARIIKRFCFTTKMWKKTNEIGDFI
jgi:acetyltransferase-like isoleucine patch superfamily enzyme